MTLPVTTHRAPYKIKPLPRPEPPAPFKPREIITLPCFVCEEDQELRLTEEQDAYVCRVCGWEVEYIINDAPPMYAIEL